MRKRKCGLCGGSVRHFFTTEKFTRSVMTETENGLEYKDKTFNVRGLGHWSCNNGCGKRHVQVERFTGRSEPSGKPIMITAHVLRDIPAVSA